MDADKFLPILYLVLVLTPLVALYWKKEHQRKWRGLFMWVIVIMLLMLAYKAFEGSTLMGPAPVRLHVPGSDQQL